MRAPMNRTRAQSSGPADSRCLVDDLLPKSIASERSGRDLQAIVKRPISERFGEVWPADGLGPVEVGDGARDLEHAMIAAGGKMHGVLRLAQKLEARRLERCDRVEDIAVRLCIDPQVRLAECREAFRLNLSRGGDAGGVLAAAFR